MTRRFVALLWMVVVVTADSPEWLEKLFQQENDNRAHHGVEPLSLNAELSQMAQAWADHFADDCSQMSHSTRDSRKYKGEAVGENIYSGSISDAALATAWSLETAPGVANVWYNEIENYPWPAYTTQKLPPNVQIFHFTQQVWKDTKEVGYGLATKDGCNQMYLVARYFPSGNWRGEYASKVLPRLD